MNKQTSLETIRLYQRAQLRAALGYPEVMFSGESHDSFEWYMFGTIHARESALGRGDLEPCQ